MNWIMRLYDKMLLNYELFSAITALILAQIIKLVLDFFLDGKLNPSILMSTGGMPSSHTALTAAMTTAFGISQGLLSPFFTISFVLTVIVAHDAAGVRWQAGKHATEINRIRKDLHNLYQAISTHESQESNRKQLKELLGHKPLEVIMGAIWGVLIAFLLSLLIM